MLIEFFYAQIICLISASRSDGNMWRSLQDVQYADIDYMADRCDFTLDEENFGELPEYITDLQDDKSMRFVIILVCSLFFSPTISTFYSSTFTFFNFV